MLYKIYERILNYKRKFQVNYYKRKLKVKQLDLSLPVFIAPLENLELGENCGINAFVHIWANAKVTIGENTMLASHVQITSSTHDYNVTPMRSFRKDMPVRIGKNVWIGAGAIIMPGVEIGDNTVIGAGSVVTRNIPANVVAYGAPARVMKEINLTR